MVHRMFPEMEVDTRCPRLADWRSRMEARPGVKAALEMPDHTAPGLRTFTGHVR
jgi:glutathione S-transferase